MMTFVVVVLVFVVLGIWYEFENSTEYDYTCTNCGFVRKSFIPPRSRRKNSCSACSHSQSNVFSLLVDLDSSSVTTSGSSSPATKV
jgi:hypothetical protein